MITLKPSSGPKLSDYSRLVIDLHTHSNCSDGSDTPEHLLELAFEADLSAIALTDHDTVAGLEAAARKAAELGITFIPGLELACQTPDRSIHMLAYLIDPTHAGLNKALVEQNELRLERNCRLIEVLNALDYEIDMAEVLEIANGATIGRPHFARALVNRGYFDSIDQAFTDLLSDQGRGFVERREFSARDAIDVIHEAGGLAVWAHPIRSRHVYNLEPTLEWLTENHLDGVETYYSRFTSEQRHFVKNATKKAGLIATGGSDYHGLYKPDLSLGTGMRNLSIPNQIIDELFARQARLFGR